MFGSGPCFQAEIDDFALPGRKRDVREIPRLNYDQSASESAYLARQRSRRSGSVGFSIATAHLRK
jgi:hypothetical protein